MRIRKDDVLFYGFIWCLVLLGIAIVVFGGFWVYQSATADSRCKAKGWTKGEVTFPATCYCYRRVDQTDHVAPCSEATPVKP